MTGALIEGVQLRILWFSVTAVLLTGLIVGAVTIIPLGSILRATTAERLEHLATIKAMGASEYSARLTGVAMQVTSRTVIRQELIAFNRGERTATQLRAFTLDKISDAMTLAPGVIGITRLSHDGTALVSVGEVPDPAVLSHLATQVTAAVKTSGASALLGPFASADGALRLAAAAPIVGHDKRHEGTDVVLFSPAGLGPLLDRQSVDEAEVSTFLGATGPDGSTAWFTSGPEGNLVGATPPAPGAGWSVAAERIHLTNWTLIAATPSKALFRHVDAVIALAAVAVVVLVGVGILVLLVLLRPMAGHALITTRELKDKVQELQTLRRQLEGERHRLKESNAELEQFAYAASHDMRQPLRMIVSFLELLRRRNVGKLDGDSLSYVQEAVDGARRLHAMIEGLLEYSRVGRLEDAQKSVDLNGALARAGANLGKMLDESGADLDCGPLPLVSAEEAQMVRLFQNLIENAVKYRHPDRAPCISVQSAPASDGFWTIRVSDNGSGMAPDQAPRAFGLFQRLHSGGTGTGLGLALCHKIVTRHGGTIALETVEGEGTTVVFTLCGAPMPGKATTAPRKELAPA